MRFFLEKKLRNPSVLISSHWKAMTWIGRLESCNVVFSFISMKFLSTSIIKIIHFHIVSWFWRMVCTWVFLFISSCFSMTSLRYNFSLFLWFVCLSVNQFLINSFLGLFCFRASCGRVDVVHSCLQGTRFMVFFVLMYKGCPISAISEWVLSPEFLK